MLRQKENSLGNYSFLQLSIEDAREAGTPKQDLPEYFSQAINRYSFQELKRFITLLSQPMDKIKEVLSKEDFEILLNFSYLSADEINAIDRMRAQYRLLLISTFLGIFPPVISSYAAIKGALFGEDGHEENSLISINLVVFLIAMLLFSYEARSQHLEKKSVIQNLKIEQLLFQVRLCAEKKLKICLNQQSKSLKDNLVLWGSDASLAVYQLHFNDPFTAASLWSLYGMMDAGINGLTNMHHIQKEALITNIASLLDFNLRLVEPSADEEIIINDDDALEAENQRQNQAFKDWARQNVSDVVYSFTKFFFASWAGLSGILSFTDIFITEYTQSTQSAIFQKDSLKISMFALYCIGSLVVGMLSVRGDYLRSLSKSALMHLQKRMQNVGHQIELGEEIAEFLKGSVAMLKMANSLYEFEVASAAYSNQSSADNVIDFSYSSVSSGEHPLASQTKSISNSAAALSAMQKRSGWLRDQPATFSSSASTSTQPLLEKNQHEKTYGLN